MVVEGRGSNRRWYPFCGLKFKELLWQLKNLTCGLRISDSPTSNNLTPQETTNSDVPDIGSDGDDFFCPGSGVVADQDSRMQIPNATINLLTPHQTGLTCHFLGQR